MSYVTIGCHAPGRLATLFFIFFLLPFLFACSAGGSPGGGTANKTQFSITVKTAGGGTLSPAVQQVSAGDTARFTVNPDRDFFAERIEGCDGRLDGNVYTTGAIDGDCEITAAFADFIASQTPTLSFVPTKKLRFTWTSTVGATHYRLLENPDGDLGFTQVGEDIEPGVKFYDHQVPLYARVNAQYILQSCVFDQCYDSGTAFVSGTLVNSIGYFKASNTGEGDQFGSSVSLSRTGDTLAVGAHFEGDGDQGAVYLFTYNGDRWEQQDYIKPSVRVANSYFGESLSLDGTGDTLAVGAGYELPNGATYVFTRSGDQWTEQQRISAPGVTVTSFGHTVSLNGQGDTLAVDASNTAATGQKEVYVFTRGNGSWVQQPEPLKVGSNTFGNSISFDDPGNTLAVGDAAKDLVYVFVRSGDNGWAQQGFALVGDNTYEDDYFGWSLSLSDDGDTLAVGAPREDGDSVGVINGPVSGQGNATCFSSSNCKPPQGFGAVYVFTRSAEVWTQQAYIKASNPEGGEGKGLGDSFGQSVSLSGTGDTLAVGAYGESSNAKGIYDNDNDSQNDNSINRAGAVYVYTRAGVNWSQQAYVKARNTKTAQSNFGVSVSLDGAGDTLAVGARRESSSATGINNGNQDDESALSAGAVYLY